MLIAQDEIFGPVQSIFKFKWVLNFLQSAKIVMNTSIFSIF